MQKKPTLPRIYRRRGMPLAWFLMDTPRRTFAGDAGDVHDLGGRIPAGARIGGCTYTNAGRNGRCLALDGTSGYVDCGASSVLNPTASMTLSGWFSYTSIPGTVLEAWLVARDDATLGRSFALGFGYQPSPSLGEFVQLEIDGIAIGPGRAGVTLGTDRWHHLAATGSPASGWMVYLDGSPVISSPWRTPAATTGHTTLGGRTYTGFNGFFTGLIDDVRIYDYALSPADVALGYADPYRRLRRPSRGAALAASATAPAAAVVYPPRSLGVYTGQAIRGLGG